MSYSIIPTHRFEKELKRLTKKFPSLNIIGNLFLPLQHLKLGFDLLLFLLFGLLGMNRLNSNLTCQLLIEVPAYDGRGDKK